MSKRILLVTRPWHRAHRDRNPVGLLDLAAWYRGQGHRVECRWVDQPVPGDHDMVGLSVFSDGAVAARDVAALRSRHPRARLVVGGRWTATMTGPEREAVEAAGAEVVSGPGEALLGEWDADLERYPSWSAQDFQTLGLDGDNVMTTRGCPYHCAFCHNIERRVASFTVERSVDHLELVLSRGAPDLFVVDDIFTLRPERMLAILRECERRALPVRGRMRFFTHVNFITPEAVEAMRAFRPLEVQVGLESGDDAMLQRMEKPFTAAKAFERVRLLASAVPVVGLFLVGFPGETESSLANTIRFVQALQPYLSSKWVSLYQPVRGTAGYALAQRSGHMSGRVQDNVDVGYVPEGMDEATLLGVRDLLMSVAVGARAVARTG